MAPHAFSCSHQRFKKWLMALSAGALCSMVSVQSGKAADSVWTGGPMGDGFEWSVPENWSAGIPGAIGTTNNQNTATFGAVESSFIYLGAGENYNLKNFLFTNTGTTSLEFLTFETELPAFNLSHGGSITVQSGFTGSEVKFSVPLVLHGQNATSNGSYTFSNVATNVDNFATPPRLVIAGGVSGGATSGAITLNLTGSTGSRNRPSSEANEITGVIKDGDAQGGLSVVVAGTNANRGAWYLSNTQNSYTGNTVLSSGTLFFNSIGNKGEDSSLGAGTTVELRGGSFFMYQGAGDSTDRNFIVGNGGISWYNTGSAALEITQGGSVQLSGGNLTFRGSQNFIIDALISGNGAVTRTDGGTVFLNHVANTFSQNISISHGAFNIKHVADSGQASSIGTGNTINLGQTNGGTGLANNTGTLIFSGENGGSTNRTIRISNGLNGTTEVGAGVLENSVAGQRLTWGGNITVANATTRSSFTLGGAGNGVLSGSIAGTPNLTLIKAGTGVWELTSANTHSHETRVQGGVLLISNSAATGTSSVITSGTGTLGGTSTISGAAGKSITIGAGSSLMVGNTHGVLAGGTGAGGYVSGASVLTLGSNVNVGLTLAGNLKFDIFSQATGGQQFGESDLLRLNTTASSIALGGTIVLGDATGNANWRSQGGTGLMEGAWKLIDWSGIGAATRTGTFNFDLSLPSLALGYQWDTSSFMTDGTVSIVESTNKHVWTGAGGNQSWSTATNWSAGTVPGSTNDVFLGGTGSIATAHDGDKTVRNIVFTGEANHTINTGSGGVLYLGGDSTNGGVIASYGGTHVINTNLRFGVNSSQTYIINNGGELRFNLNITANQWGGQATNKVLTFSGTGDTWVNGINRRHNTYNVSIIKNGTGTVTINGADNNDAGADSTGTFTGSTTINEGKIRINQERALGGNAEFFDANHLTLNGGTLGAFGSFTIDDTNRGTMLGQNGGTFDVEGSHALGIANSVRGAGQLRKTGTGTLNMIATSYYTGDTHVEDGILNVASTEGSATGSGSVFIKNNAMLSGSGRVAGKDGGSINLAANTRLRVGSSHGTAGAANMLQLGSAGAVNIAVQGTLQLDIFGAGSDADYGDESYNILGSSNDLLKIETEGSLNLSGARVEISALDTLTWVDGHIWKLIDWSSVGAGNVNTDGMQLITQNIGEFRLEQVIRNDGYYVVAIVPEPGRVTLLMLACGAVLLRRKRRK